MAAKEDDKDWTKMENNRMQKITCQKLCCERWWEGSILKYFTPFKIHVLWLIVVKFIKRLRPFIQEVKETGPPIWNY